MNVADSKSTGNPNSDSPLTPEELCRQIDQMADALKHNVRAAAKSAESFDVVERDINDAQIN